MKKKDTLSDSAPEHCEALPNHVQQYCCWDDYGLAMGCLKAEGGDYFFQIAPFISFKRILLTPNVGDTTLTLFNIGIDL
ncbi:MAG: hypothetical protein ACLRSA_00020 [Streptococcus salivarius]